MPLFKQPKPAAKLISRRPGDMCDGLRLESGWLSLEASAVRGPSTPWRRVSACCKAASSGLYAELLNYERIETAYRVGLPISDREVPGRGTNRDRNLATDRPSTAMQGTKAGYLGGGFGWSAARGQFCRVERRCRIKQMIPRGCSAPRQPSKGSCLRAVPCECDIERWRPFRSRRHAESLVIIG